MDAPDLNCIQFFRLISINRRGLLPGALCRSPNTMSGVRSKKPISFFQLIPHLQCCKQMNCCFILRPQFGQVLLLFPIALNVQTVFIQQEIIDAHNQDTILIVIRCRSILGDDDPLEEISGQHQRTLFLLHLRLIRNRVSGLDIVAVSYTHLTLPTSLSV